MILSIKNGDINHILKNTSIELSLLSTESSRFLFANNIILIGKHITYIIKMMYIYFIFLLSLIKYSWFSVSNTNSLGVEDNKLINLLSLTFNPFLAKMAL